MTEVTELLIRYAHFVGIISFASLLVSQNILLVRTVEVKILKRLAVIDGLYGLSAVVTLVAGLFLWYVVGKPSEFYSANPLFQIKLSIFLFIALISLAPTAFFLKNRKYGGASIEVPTWLINIKRAELGLLFLLPLLAVLMARGIGLS